MDALNKFETTVDSHFPMLSEIVLEENLSYPGNLDAGGY